MKIPFFSFLYPLESLKSEIEKADSLDSKQTKELSDKIKSVLGKNINFDNALTLIQSIDNRVTRLDKTEETTLQHLQELKVATQDIFNRSVGKLASDDEANHQALREKIGATKNEDSRILILYELADKAIASVPELIAEFKITDSSVLEGVALKCADKDPLSVAKHIKDFGITDQKALAQIALKCAENDPVYVVNHIKDFGITDQAGLVQIALKCADKDPSSVAYNIKDFGITGQKDLVQIALKCAEKDPSSVASDITKFGITDQKALAQIALKCAENDPVYVVNHIKDFGITDQAGLVQIALKCAEKMPLDVVSNIKDFGITDADKRAEIALKCAKGEDGIVAVAENIQNFGITDQGILVQIALKCAEKNPSSVASDIKNFGITDRATLDKIALKCAEKNPSSVAYNIKNFGITDQVDLVQIVLKCVEQEPSSVAEYIKDFGITDQAGLAQIALKCAENDPVYVVNHIKDFGITDQAGLVQIALQCAEKNPSSVASNIKNFGIIDQKVLIQIALKCVEKDPMDIVSIIRQFKITDQVDLVQIVLKCVEQEPSSVAYNIKNFGITDQAGLVQIALKCVEQEPSSVAYNIKDFGITDQAGLAQIALQCAEKDPSSVAYNIKKFGITDQKALAQIALKCVEQEPLFVVMCIRNFGIIDQKVLIQIALQCAEKDPRYVVRHINKFGITDQKALVQIALQCAEKNPSSVASNITNFGITDRATLDKIALKCAEKDPGVVARHIQNFGITAQNILVKIALQCAKGSPLEQVSKGEAGYDIFKLQKADFSKIPHQLLRSLYQNTANDARSVQFFADPLTIRLLNLHPDFKDYIQHFCPNISTVDTTDLTESAQATLKAASMLSGSQKLDIPDPKGFTEIPYRAVKDAFGTFTDEDLTGIVGINEMMLTPEEHRANFDYFLSFVERDYAITGAIPANVKEKYEPFKRLMKHLAVKLPTMQKSEQISALSQFSRIANKAYCLEPYLKSCLFVYNIIKDDSAEAIDVQEPVKKLQGDLRSRLLVVRDTQFNTAIKNTKASPVDTHSENWAKNALSQAAGYERITDEEDPFLGHGMTKLARHLRLGEDELKLKTYLEEGFEKGLVLKMLEGFSKVLDDILNPQSPSSAQGENPLNSQVVIDYFRNLIEGDLGDSVQQEKQDLANPGAVDTFMASMAQTPKYEKEMKVLKGNLTDAEKGFARATKNGVKDAQQLDNAFAESGMKDAQVYAEEELDEANKAIENLQVKMTQSTQRYEEAKATLGEDKCRILDALFNKKRARDLNIENQKWIVSEDILDPDGKAMLDNDYMVMERTTVTAEGRFALFKLFMSDEIRSVQRLEAK